MSDNDNDSTSDDFDIVKFHYDTAAYHFDRAAHNIHHAATRDYHVHCAAFHLDHIAAIDKYGPHVDHLTPDDDYEPSPFRHPNTGSGSGPLALVGTGILCIGAALALRKRNAWT